MKRYWLAGLVVLALVLGMAWLLAGVPAAQAPLPAAATATTSAPQDLSPTVAAASGQNHAAAPQPQLPQGASADAGLNKAAILSMREARVNGDARTPPMSPPAVEREPPTAAELADPKLYAGYEKTQRLKAYQSYVNAVPKKVATLQKALDEAAQPGSGITPEQLAFARKKIADLDAMQQKLLAEHPELTAPAVSPAP